MRCRRRRLHHPGQRRLALHLIRHQYNSFVSDAPFSYEGLYERVGYQMAECYNEAAQNVINAAVAEYNRVCTEIANNMITAASNMVAGMMANLPVFP